MKVNQAHHPFFNKLLQLLEEAGVSPAQLFAELAQRGIASYGSFGFALMSCANVRETVRLMLRYGQVLFQPSWTAHEHEDGLLLRARLSIGTAAQQQLLAELIFSNLVAVGRQMYGSTVERADGVEIHLSYSRPAHSACYKRAFNTPVKFDCEFSQLFLPAQVLDTPVRTANRSQHVLFQQQCEEMMRGLEAESTSFRSILDEIRDLLAREYLAKTELTIVDIAHLLDYAETVSFRRAAVRWNSVTPNGYRQQKMAELK